jgi:uncharacterized protein YbjT (DUF2867 family)
VKLLLVGATGLVGRHVLALALTDSRINSVVAPTRRKLPEHPSLLSPRVNFDRLPTAAKWWQSDAVICTLGTTLRKAGSQESFRRVDYDYPLTVAQLARTCGTPTYVLNSAISADPSSSFFYNRVKGELELALSREGFASLTFVRPGVISGRRDEFRPGERVLAFGLALAAPVLPRRWRLNPALKIARALLEAAIMAKPGVSIITSDKMI